MQELYELSRPHSLWARRGRHQDAIALLQRVSEQNSLEVLPPVAAHLFSGSEEVRAEARRAVHHLLSNASSDDLLHLTEAIGWSWGWYISEKWNELSPKEVSTLVADDSARSSLLGLVSFHRSGYVRHEAVKLLSRIRDGSELAYLLIRQNDWVNPISADARAAVQVRLTQDYLPHFLRYLPLAIHLLAFSRYDHSFIVKRVVEMLVQPQNNACLASAIESSSRAVRRAVVRIALDIHGDHQKRVVVHGLASADAVVRLHCSKIVRQCFSHQELSAILERLKRDRFMPVRREGLAAEAEMFSEEATQVWEGALLDSNPSIRDLARFNLAKSGHFDAADFYRRALVQQTNSLAAFQGLTETGEKSDVPVFRTHLNDLQPRWRRAAIRGLVALGKEAVVKEAVGCLRDKSPSVVRVACQQLRGLLDSSANDQLFAILTEDDRQNIREVILRLISSTGKWQSLPWLIQSSLHRDLNTAALGQELVRAWFHNNKVFTKPSDSQRQALQEAWNASERLMPEPFRKELRLWLDSI